MWVVLLDHCVLLVSQVHWPWASSAAGRKIKEMPAVNLQSVDTNREK